MIAAKGILGHGVLIMALGSVAGCTSSEPLPATGEHGRSASAPIPSPAAVRESSATPTSYEPDLQWMLDKTAPAEDPARPCLMRQPPRPAWVDDPEARRRLREVRSDSYWLGRWARENLEDRLAYATVRYDWEPVGGEAPPLRPPPLIYEIAVTGSERINPPPLGGRAKGVRVKVVYDVPVGFDEFMRRREQGGSIARQVLDTIGEGGSPENGWAVRLSVFSKDGQPDPRALAQCDRLRRAYRLPVLMEFMAARSSPS